MIYVPMTNPSSQPALPAVTPSNPAAERWAHLIQQASLCGRQLRRLLAQHITRWNISDTEFLVLWACNHAPDFGLAQNELACMLGVSAAQMSGLAYDLRDRGFLSFERTERDRRRQVLRVSGQGRLLLSKILVDLEPLVEKLGKHFADEEQILAEQILERLTLASQAETRPPSSDEPDAARASTEPNSLRRAS